MIESNIGEISFLTHMYFMWNKCWPIQLSITVPSAGADQDQAETTTAVIRFASTFWARPHWDLALVRAGGTDFFVGDKIFPKLSRSTFSQSDLPQSFCSSTSSFGQTLKLGQNCDPCLGRMWTFFPSTSTPCTTEEGFFLDRTTSVSFERATWKRLPPPANATTG